MEKTPQNKQKAVAIFRIAICVIAILALSCAITYMIRGLILDINATNRLLANAFLSYTESTKSDTTDTHEEEAAVVLPEKVAIVGADVSVNRPTITNYTSYAVDERALADRKFSYYAYGASPLVLILHTHANEAYAPDGITKVEKDHPFENSDPQKNIFAVGEAICELLNATGIGTVHVSEEVTDPAKTIGHYRALYPSLQFVLDVHRDGLYTDDGRIVATKGEIDGKSAAQLMLAVGTGASSQGFDFRENLAAAYSLATVITDAEDKVMRPILLRPEDLHQQYAPCSLSLYVGTAGNTLEEALQAARFFARYYAIFILNARNYG